ncbi:MAG: hypothetical protein E7Z89_01035 [Cyanobacteria bacterium SIG28]|nr:hypothetical protein [Cyanobacteria bacterium SIG28]
MNKKQYLKKQIQQLELQIKKITSQSASNEVSESLCNSLILKKAIVKKELADLDKNPIVEKIKSFIPHKEKLICDYFGS